MNPAAFHFDQVSKRYGQHQALQQVTLEIAAGECVALLGVNGAGKTSLLRCLLGFVTPDAGAIGIFGRAHHAHAARAPLCFLPERFIPPAFMTGREFARHLCRLHGQTCADAELQALAAALELDPAALSRPLRAFSKGMTQKLGLAAALLTDKPAYVLDEPASGLDPKARALLRARLQALRAAGKTILFTTHDLGDADALADRVAILHAGALRFYGTPSNCRARYDAQHLDGAFLRCIA